MRVLAITGATGFIGGALLAACERDWRVRILVRGAGRRRVPAGPDTVIGSLGDGAALTTLVRGADAVVHCAGAVRGARAREFHAVNAQGTAELVKATALLAPHARFLLVSSLAARVPELSPYAQSKRAAEAALSAHAGPVSWVALRPPAVYGPRDRELLPLLRLMMHGVAPVIGATDARFSLLHVDDFIAAIRAWLAQPEPAAGVFELDDGHPRGYTWGDVAAVMARLRARPVRQIRLPDWLLDAAAAINIARGRCLGLAPMLTPWKLRELRHPDWVCDNAAYRAAVEWEPRLGLEDGVRNTLAAAGIAAS